MKVVQLQSSDLESDNNEGLSDAMKSLTKKYLEIEKNRKKSCEKYYQ